MDPHWGHRPPEKNISSKEKQKQVKESKAAGRAGRAGSKRNGQDQAAKKKSLRVYV